MCSFGSNNSAPTSQSSVQTTIADPRAAAMYGQAWQNAQKTAQRPFQPYSYDPNAFVAPMNSTQMTAVNNLYGVANAGQPYYEAAPGMAYASGNTNAAGLVPQYMNPYLGSVAQATMGYLNQQQAQDRNRLNGQIAANGQWGNDRSGIERAILAGQQNLATANTISGLYNQGYNTALSAAQADLNRQLQASGQLSGQGLGSLQALLGAGTLGQQTQQAGLKALYDQYMLQQQFPFMEAQFLSSTAAGLGPGYGSTTYGTQTSQQPLSSMGNPLSDPKLKLGAGGSAPEVIGQTHDGQDIYRYRLVDPDSGRVGPAQIGLMADEVEQRRPDAVGNYHGFRTVDYERATDNAARLGGLVSGRGDYADGGSIDDILRTQEAMYQGLSKPSGGIVPQTQMPTAKLDAPQLKYMPPQQKEKQPGLADQALGLYDTGKKLSSAGSEISSGLEGLNLADKLGISVLPSSFSGAASTAASAAPAVAETAAEAAPAAASFLEFLPEVLAMFSDRRLKTGVRGYADGGGVEPDDDFLDRLFRQESGGKQFNRRGEPIISPKGAVGIAQVMPGTMPEAARYAGLEPSLERLRSDPEYNAALGRAYLKHQLNAFGGDKEMALGAYNAGPSRVERAVARANANGGDWKDYLPRETQAYIPAVMGKGLAPTGRALALAAPEPRPAHAGLDAMPTGSIPTAKASGLAPTEDTSPAQGLSGMIRGTPASGLGEKALDFATSERFLVPLLTGLGTMASSGSRYLAPAILQGLGAGASAYMQVPKTQAETAKAAEEARTQAEETRAKHQLVGKIGAEAQKQLIENFKSSIYTTPYGNFVFLDNGMPVSMADYMEMWRQGRAPQTLGSVPKDAEQAIQGSSTTSGSPAASGTPGATPEERPQSPSSPAEVPKPAPQKVENPNDIYDNASAEVARKEQRIAENGGFAAEQAAKRSTDYNSFVSSEATTARENAPYINEMASTLADAYQRHGLNEPGFKANLRSEISSMLNTFWRAAGGDEQTDFSKLKENKDIVEKISTLLSTNRAAGAGQHAVEALKTIKAAIPNLEMDKNAGAELTAQLMALQQRAIDRDSHLRAYMGDSNGMSVNANADFARKSATRYAKEQKVLKDIILNAPEFMKQAMSGSATPEQIDAEIRRAYGKNAPTGMWRYFYVAR